MTKLSSANKNLVVALRDNARLERLLGQCRLGYRTEKITGTGGSLLGTHYCWLCGCNSDHPSFKCTDRKTGHVMNEKKANMQGGSDKNNPEQGWLRQEYVENNIRNLNYLNVLVS